jgi:hypothetical protein
VSWWILKERLLEYKTKNPGTLLGVAEDEDNNELCYYRSRGRCDGDIRHSAFWYFDKTYSLLLVHCWDYQGFPHHTLLELTGTPCRLHETLEAYHNSKNTTSVSVTFRMLLIKNCDIIVKQKTLFHYAQAGKMEAVEFFNQDFYKRIIRFVICGTTNGITK